METIRKIRLAARDGNKSIREIARDLNLSRNTVRKVLRSDETEFKYERSIIYRPRLGPYMTQLEGWLEVDQALSAKRRRSAQVLYEALQEAGYRGGYDTVRRYVKAWRLEHQVKLVRRRFFTPRRQAKTLQTLNESLQGECMAWAQSHRHPELKDRTIWDVFEAERSALISLPPPFEGYAERAVRVSSTSLVSFDRNRYSVDCRAVGQVVQLRSYADRIVVLHDGQMIAEHGRQFGRDRMIFDPWHYLPVLKRKPGALRNGAPFKDWHLPRALQRVRQRMRTFMVEIDSLWMSWLVCRYMDWRR